MIGVASGETALIVRITGEKRWKCDKKNNPDTYITCFRAFPVFKSGC